MSKGTLICYWTAIGFMALKTLIRGAPALVKFLPEKFKNFIVDPRWGLFPLGLLILGTLLRH